MADLTARLGPPEDGHATRGQIILVAGFALALALIALALVMNSAIYTENLATRSESSGTAAAQTYQRAVANATSEAVRYANGVNDGGYDALNRNVTGLVSEASTLMARQQVVSGHVANFSVAATENGTAIADHGNDDFTDAGGNAEWTLTSGADHVKRFRIKVTDRSELDLSSDEEFRVVFSNATERWTLNVSKTPSSTAVVGVNDTDSYGECPVSSPQFWVNVSAGTVGGDPCPALDASKIPEDFDLEFRNATAIEGNYSLVVDEAEVGRPVFDSGGPTADEVLYSVTVEVVYRTPELRYWTEIRVAPGETDA